MGPENAERPRRGFIFPRISFQHRTAIDFACARVAVYTDRVQLARRESEGIGDTARGAGRLMVNSECCASLDTRQEGIGV